MAERQWSDLPKDILGTIAKCLNTRTDILRLRSVCTSWRSSVPRLKHNPSFSLTLPFPISPNPSLNKNRRGTFSLSQSTIYFLLPPPRDQNSPYPPKPWLFRVEELQNGKLHPLNPLSKILTENVPSKFPKVLNLLNLRIFEIGIGFGLQFVETTKNVNTTFGELKSLVIKKVVVSSSPLTPGGDDYAIMVIHGGGKLGFIKLGRDEKWKSIDDPKQCDDVVYHKGQFYAVDHKGRAVVVGLDLVAKEIAAPIPYGGGQFKYLVKLGDDLFLIDKYMYAKQEISYDDFLGVYSDEENDPDDVKVHLIVYKLEEEEKKWEWVDSLGDNVFFVGDDCSYAVSAGDFGGLKGNCIYFLDDSFTGENENLGDLCPDTGVYSMEDGRCGPLASFKIHSKIFWPPPAWLL